MGGLVMKKICLCLLIVAGCCAASQAAEENDPKRKPKTAEEIREEIDRLQKRIDRLGEAEFKAEQVEEEKEEFADLQAASRERLAEYAERRNEIENDEEPSTDERNKYVNALITHVNLCRQIDEKIVGLKDHTALEEAKKLADSVELLHAEWYMVTERSHDMASQLADMRNAVADAERPGLAARVKGIQDLHQRDMAAAKKQFELWKARTESEKKLRAQIHAFWEAVEEGEEEDPED